MIAIVASIVVLVAIAIAYVEVPVLLNRGHTGPSSSEVNYPGEFGNPNNWAWSADRGIQPTNASLLSLKAYQAFPFQTTPFLAGGLGRAVALSGVAYVANAGNYELYAMNVQTQTELYDKPIPNAPNYSLPMVFPLFHTLTTQFNQIPRVWISTPWFGIYGYQALGGFVDNAFNVTAPARGHSGNLGAYQVTAPNFVIDEQRQIAVTGLHVNVTGTPGRGFVEGWKIGNRSATPSWTTFLSPTEDHSDPTWELNAVKSAQHVWVFNGTGAIDLKTLSSSSLDTMLTGDWGSQSGKTTFSSGPEANSSWIVDSSNDRTYIVTSPPLPTTNADSFNGPALFSSSIIALDTTSGSIIWTFQVTPHDVWGWGCKGNLMMVPATVSGSQKQVLVKQCENGYLYMLDPATGALIYATQVPGVQRPPTAQIPVIQNQADMRTSLASLTSRLPSQEPSSLLYGANIAYDPDSGLILGTTGMWAAALGTATERPTSWNSTAYAFDVNKDTFAWQYDEPNQEFSYIGTSNGVAYLGTYQGELYVVMARTGSALQDRHMGMSVSSLLVTDDLRGQPGLVVTGDSPDTRQQVYMELFTPNGA